VNLRLHLPVAGLAPTIPSLGGRICFVCRFVCWSPVEGLPTFGRRVNLRLHLPVAGWAPAVTRAGGRMGTGSYTCRWPDGHRRLHVPVAGFTSLFTGCAGTRHPAFQWHPGIGLQVGLRSPVGPVCWLVVGWGASNLRAQGEPAATPAGGRMGTGGYTCRWPDGHWRLHVPVAGWAPAVTCAGGRMGTGGYMCRWPALRVCSLDAPARRIRLSSGTRG